MYRAILSTRGPVYFHFIIIARAQSHASAASKDRLAKESPFVYNYINVRWLLLKNDLCECMKFTLLALLL